MVDKNCISYWYPKLTKLDILTPGTLITTTDIDLARAFLENKKADDDIKAFLAKLLFDVDTIGLPCFIRTGHFSGKHSWDSTCYLQDRNKLIPHVSNLIEWSLIIDVIGLPVDTWAVREFLETEPMFYAFDNMPINKEWRYFIRDGEVEYKQPYWPVDSIRMPSCENWEELLRESYLEDYPILEELSLKIATEFDDYWSVDFMPTKNGWYCVDMAEGDQSFRWEGW